MVNFAAHRHSFFWIIRRCNSDSVHFFLKQSYEYLLYSSVFIADLTFEAQVLLSLTAA
jgi:hypothetical protein